MNYLTYSYFNNSLCLKATCLGMWKPAILNISATWADGRYKLVTAVCRLTSGFLTYASMESDLAAREGIVFTSVEATIQNQNQKKIFCHCAIFWHFCIRKTLSHLLNVVSAPSRGICHIQEFCSNCTWKKRCF